jgi:CheY-like chemotaxis protein
MLRHASLRRGWHAPLPGRIARTYARGQPVPPHAMTPGPHLSATRGVRVLTVDDQELFRDVARDVIEATPGFVAVGEAASGEEGIEAVERLEPELVLIDVRMPGLNGIEVARRLVETHPGIVFVLISIEDRIDVPSAAQLSDVPFVRKQDFGPRLLRRLWTEHGR